jgi:hypothetical protein
LPKLSTLNIGAMSFMTKVPRFDIENITDITI